MATLRQLLFVPVTISAHVTWTIQSEGGLLPTDFGSQQFKKNERQF